MNQKKAKRLRKELREKNVGVVAKNGVPLPSRMLIPRKDPPSYSPPSRKRPRRMVGVINHPLTFRSIYKSLKKESG